MAKRKPKPLMKSSNGKHPPAAEAAPNADTGTHVGIPVGTPVGALVPQKRGGAIRNGGTNRGGTGRPPDHIRMKSRAIFDKFLEWAELQQLDPKVKAKVMLEIGKTSGRYGFPPEDSISRQLVRALLAKQLEELSKVLPPEHMERAVAVLEPIWSTA